MHIMKKTIKFMTIVGNFKILYRYNNDGLFSNDQLGYHYVSGKKTGWTM